jgi:hypothetical protein
MLAARARQRAAAVPGADQIRALADRALSEPRESMTASEIRALTAEALAQAQQVSSLLTRLAGLLGDEAGSGDGR